MDEHVIVRYPTERKVFVDGKELGLTGKVLTVERGTHRFDLGQPLDYVPKFRRPKVTGTSLGEPMEVVFEEA
jgi:hypothetical protein